MPQQSRTSNCSIGVRVDFYWHDCRDPGGHVEAAVAALWEAVDAPERRWNPFRRAMVLAEFRGRLKLAQAGELKPIDHVKEIGEGDVLFEIRWPHVGVSQVNGAGEVEHVDIEVRLLHAEPVELSVCAVGLHAHEKAIFPGDRRRTRDAQDAEIAVAIQRYHSGVATQWGVAGA
jgi:hypothetical protein